MTFDIVCMCSKGFEDYGNANRPSAPIISGVIWGVASSTTPREISAASSVGMLDAHASFSAG